jgi:hypothetical protein
LALRAVEVRFSDRANAYRRLWQIAAIKANDGGAAEVANAFCALLSEVEPATRLLGDDATDIALACLEALDRALRSRVPDGVADEIRNLTLNGKSRLAIATLGDMLSPLAAKLFVPGLDMTFLNRYDVRCQIAIVACLAVDALGNRGGLTPFERLMPLLGSASGESVSLLPEGLRLSLYRHDPSFESIVQPLTVPSQFQGRSVFHRLETALVRLQRFDGSGKDLPPIPHVAEQTDVLHRFTSLILRVWSPGDDAREAEDVEGVELDAASTLVNVTYKHFAKVAASRPRLIHLIVGQKGAQALPSPPGLAASGVLLWCEDGSLLLASAGDAEPALRGVVWQPTSTSVVGQIRLMRANLEPGARPLFSDQAAWTPARIASIYRSGFDAFTRLLDPASDEVPIPTAFSFFGLENDGVLDPSSIRLICWTASKLSVDSHAFVRIGTALEARAVHAKGADYWRFGWAVRDLCGRVDGPADGDSALYEHGDVSLERENHRQEAIIARVLPRLSGADRWGPGEVRPGSLLPTRVERALRLLEAFGRSSSASSHAAYLVAAAAEGLFMSQRLNAVGDAGISGRPAALAFRAAWRVSRSLPAAVAHWPAAECVEATYRRSAVAWFDIAGRLSARIESVEPDAERPIRMLVLGVELLGTVSELRALSFEIASVLPGGTISRLRSVPIDLTQISELIGHEVVLLETTAALDDLSLDSQASRLFGAFEEIIIGRRSSAAAVRDAITPLGWAVLVSTLLQVTPPKSEGVELGHRPALWSMSPEAIGRAKASIEGLVPFLGAAAHVDVGSDLWPWDVFGPVADAQPPNIKELLRELTDAAGLQVHTVQSWSNPRTGESLGGRPVMRLADGSSHRLSEWQIEVAYVSGERGTATESNQVGYRTRYAYSVTKFGDRVLGMHFVSRGLAEVAFGGSSADSTVTSGSEVAADTDESGPPVRGGVPLGVALESADLLEDTNLPPAIASSGGQTALQPAATYATEQAGAGQPANVANNTAPDEFADGAPQIPSLLPSNEALTSDDVIATIRAKQTTHWQKRSVKAPGLQRVAIVQWDVLETYSGPGYDDGKHEGLYKVDGSREASKVEVSEGGIFLSVAEARRRAILQEVLRACDQFKVDGLVLSEYSVRPETVNWIARQLAQLNLPITVWCGTFRVPDGGRILSAIPPYSGIAPYIAELTSNGLGLNSWDSHTALLTCLDAVQVDVGYNVRWHVRSKRYPSAAANEIIRPPIKEPWRPLLEDHRDPFKLGSFTVELICSEMFPHASSANFIGVLEENRRLASRYGLQWSDNEAIKVLNDDVHVFARWTAYRNSNIWKELARKDALQRTIMILPAMTTRSADYHIFGQNQYLAAGLVTAFCNAVEYTAGCGGSAFIGLDGWKSTAAVPTAYGSVAPGIFQLGDRHSGPLGTMEAAMVIADLDPIRTTDQRPRPHYQTRALELVAHLPLMFATEADPNDKKRRPGQRRSRQRADQHGRNRDFAEAARIVLAVLESPPIWRDERAVPNPDPVVRAGHERILEAIVLGLRVLEDFADDPVWLRKRTEAFIKERWTYAPPTFLPALTDWLYVDDRWTQNVAQPVDGHPFEVDVPILDVPRACNHVVASTAQKNSAP